MAESVPWMDPEAAVSTCTESRLLGSIYIPRRVSIWVRGWAWHWLMGMLDRCGNGNGNGNGKLARPVGCSESDRDHLPA